jgi:hypothetical protein
MKLRSAKKVWDRQSTYRKVTRERARRRILRWCRRVYHPQHDFAVAT